MRLFICLFVCFFCLFFFFNDILKHKKRREMGRILRKYEKAEMETRNNLVCVSDIHYCGISQVSARLLRLIFNYVH